MQGSAGDVRGCRPSDGTPLTPGRGCCSRNKQGSTRAASTGSSTHYLQAHPGPARRRASTASTWPSWTAPTATRCTAARARRRRRRQRRRRRRGPPAATTPPTTWRCSRWGGPVCYPLPCVRCARCGSVYHLVKSVEGDMAHSHAAPTQAQLKALEGDVDLLLTCEWPRGLTTGIQGPLPEGGCEWRGDAHNRL